MSGPPTSCAHCGAPLGIGRFCTNCGAEIGSVPLVPREPSYDDTGEGELASYDGPPRRGSLGALVWVGAVVALLVVVLVAGWSLLLRGSGSSHGGTASPTLLIPPHTRASVPATPVSSATRTSPSSAASSSPSSSASAHGPAVDVAGLARASAPANAPAAVDFGGNPVTYVAANLVDGTAETCWRTAGDATGTVLTFRLDQPTRLTRVGLVNGYAKTAFSGGRPFDWYLGNRRVLSVDWLFDDGTSVSQTFSQTRQLQRLRLTPVTTSTVRLRITSVSAPGAGPAARDDTAISEVSLVGSPAG